MSDLLTVYDLAIKRYDAAVDLDEKLRNNDSNREKIKASREMEKVENEAINQLVKESADLNFKLLSLNTRLETAIKKIEEEHKELVAIFNEISGFFATVVSALAK